MTEWDEVVNSPNPPTIPAPWESLTKALPYRGWRHGKLTLIAARAGDGLTTMGLEAARHASGLGHRVLMFSLRYAPLTMQARMIAAGPASRSGRSTARWRTRPRWTSWTRRPASGSRRRGGRPPTWKCAAPVLGSIRTCSPTRWTSAAPAPRRPAWWSSTRSRP